MYIDTWKRIMAFVGYILFLVLIQAGMLIADNELIISEQAPIILPAFETVGVNIIYDGDDNTNATMTMKYRLSKQSVWKTGHDGVWVESYPNGRPPVRKEMATRLFGLKAGTTYDVEVTFADMDGISGKNKQVFQVTTRAEPKIINNGGSTWHVRADIKVGRRGKSFSRAFTTLADALAVVSAGDTILLYDGEHVISERIFFDKNGTADKPIIIKAAPRCKPVVRGPLSGLEKSRKTVWKKYRDGIYYATLANKPSQVFYKTDYLGQCDNLINLANGQRRHGKRILDIGLKGGWFYENKKLYVKYCKTWNNWNGGTENPQVAGIQPVARYIGNKPAFYITGSHIVFDGITFEYFGTAIMCKYHSVGHTADNITIRNCKFRFNDLALAFEHSTSALAYSGVNNVLVDKCEFSCSPSYWFRDWTLGHDIYNADCLSASALRGKCGVVRNCDFRDAENGVFVGSWSMSPKSDPDITPGWVVKDCHFSGLGDDGVEFESSGYQCVALRNTINQTLTGISCAPCSVGPVWVIRNTIYQSDRLNPLGLLDDRSNRYPNGPFKFNVQTGPGGPLGKAILIISYHNSVYVSSTLSGTAASSRIFQPTPGLRWRSRNDSFVRSTKGGMAFRVIRTVLDSKIYGQGEEDILDIDFDYDNFWTANDIFARDRGGKYKTFKEWQNAGYNPHGRSVKSPYSKPEISDFRLSRGSALRDKGIHIPGINDNYKGKAPDIGSYETP